MSLRNARPDAGACAEAPTARLAASRAAIGQQLRVQAAAPARVDRLAREHPWLWLAGAALAGAGVVALRPWRWLPRPPVLAPMLAQMAWQALAARQARRDHARAAAGREPGGGASFR